MKFTVEIGNSTLPFLDVEIQIIDCKFVFSIYRKSTFTGILLNYMATCPLNWKKGLVNGMFHRAYNICSSWHLLDCEFRKIYDILFKNGYSKNFLDGILSRFLNHKFSDICETNSKSNDSKYVFILPFIDIASLNFRRKLKKLFKSIDVDVQIIFRSLKVSSYFSLKSKTDLSLRTNVVYRFTCLADPNLFYIGKTKRFFGLRFSEHTEKDQKSSVHQHIISCNSCRNCDLLRNFDIIDSARNDFELKILEALHISKSQPILNKQLFESGSSFVLNLFN